MSTEQYQIGNLELNAGTQEVTREGVAVPLPPLSFSLLLTLARNAPNVVTTEQLEQEVWKGLVVDRGTINKRVVLVRNALRKAGCEQDYIAVIRGTGYRLAVPVLQREDLPEGQGVDVASTERLLDRPGAGQWKRYGLLGGLVLLVLVLVITTDRQGPTVPSLSSSGTVLEPDGRPQSMDINSVAVLRLSTASDDPQLIAFAEQISREVIRILGVRSNLEVAPAPEALSFTGNDQPLTDIGLTLGVESLLTGVLRRDGERVSITAQLTEVVSGAEIWSHQFERPVSDLPQLQEQLAAQVAHSLNGALDRVGQLSSPRSTTSNLQAFNLYLEGKTLLDNRVLGGSENIHSALERFESAIALDSDFVGAHVGVATTYFLLPYYDDDVEGEAYLERAEASARYALALDPESPEALGVLAAVTSWAGDPLGAAGLFDRAQRLGNRDPDVLHWHAMLSTSLGYFEALQPLLREAYRLDPSNQLLGCSLAESLSFSGKPEEALMILDGMQDFSRREFGIAMSSLYLGHWDRAREKLSGLELREGVLDPEFANLVVDSFEHPLRREQVELTLLQAVQESRIDALVAFEVLLIMGSPRAFELEVDLRGTLFENRLPEVVWNNWSHLLRHDERFKAWIRALGYDQHWRKYGWPDRCRPTGVQDFECV